MIALLIVVFLVILFIVTIVLSASTWRAWHIVAACMTFLAALGLVVVGSLSLRTHNQWRKEHATVSKKLADARHAGLVLEHGDPLLVRSPTPSVDDLQHALTRSLLDRGRVWRRCTPGVPANNVIPVATVPPTETGEPGAPNTAKPSGIEKKMVLYAFLENDRQIPVAYLGEFQVADAQPGAVTLQPTMPMDVMDPQIQKWASIRPASWTLYEMMPIDSHQAFSDEDLVGKILDDKPDPIFGKMNEQALRELFAMITEQQVDSPLVEQLVEAYRKDGSPASELDVNQSPENIWLKVEFKKQHSEPVNSSNPSAGLDDKYFDQTGMAVAPQLRRSREMGEEAAMRVGDVGVFPYGYDEDKRLVDALTSGGTCRSLGPYFVRSLRDYEGALHDIQDRYFRCLEATRRAQRDVAALEATKLETQKQIAYRQEEKSKVQQDLEGFQRDQTKLTELVATLESQKTSLLEDLSNLFRTNRALDQQLTEYNAKLTEEINRRAADVATVQSP